MLKLIYSTETKEIAALKERLASLSLAYKEAQETRGSIPFFAEGQRKYLGVAQMNLYLDQLDREKEQWYYCNC